MSGSVGEKNTRFCETHQPVCPRRIQPVSELGPDPAPVSKGSMVISKSVADPPRLIKKQFPSRPPLSQPLPPRSHGYHTFALLRIYQKARRRGRCRDDLQRSIIRAPLSETGSRDQIRRKVASNGPTCFVSLLSGQSYDAGSWTAV